MTEQTAWLLAILAVLAAALIGFFVGRQFGGSKKRLEVLESENSRQKEEISAYRRDVESHFDKTASLFASMAGSYKDLFEHLSSGYEKLSEGSARELFRDRIAALLLEGGKDRKGAKQLLEEGVTSPSPALDREGVDKPVGSAAAAAAAAAAAGAAEAGEQAAPATAADDAVADEATGTELPPAEVAKKEVRGEAAVALGEETVAAATDRADSAAATRYDAEPGTDAGTDADADTDAQPPRRDGDSR